MAIIQPNPLKAIDVEVKRGDVIKALTVTPEIKVAPDGKEVGIIGVFVKPEKFPDDLMREVRYGAIDGLHAALKRTWDYTILTLEIMGKMVVGKVSLNNLSGPITIAQGAGQTALIGFSYYIGFLALISISLGVINCHKLLPAINVLPCCGHHHIAAYHSRFISR